MGIGGFLALVWSVALMWFDVRFRRLPDALTLPAGAVALGSLWFWPAGAWGLVWPAVYLFAGRGVGGGDVKLALPLGVAVAAAAPHAPFLWVLAAVGASGAVTLIVALAAGKRSAPHGPSMLCAAWLCAACANLCPH